MKRGLFAVLAAVFVAASTGCAVDHCHTGGYNAWGGGCAPASGCSTGSCGSGHAVHAHHGGDGCSSCASHTPVRGRLKGAIHGVANHHNYDHYPRGAGGQQVAPVGPPTGAVAYPYYTTRGPRDFLARNPASIGP